MHISINPITVKMWIDSLNIKKSNPNYKTTPKYPILSALATFSNLNINSLTYL